MGGDYIDPNGDHIYILGKTEYISEECTTCGTHSMVRREDKGKWQHCAKCSKNIKFKARDKKDA